MYNPRMEKLPKGKGEKTMATKCKYCGSSSYGRNCSLSPEGKEGSGSGYGMHVHIPGENKCIYCGSTSTGRNCSLSPVGKEGSGSGYGMHVKG